METPQEQFEAATRLLLSKFQAERLNKYDNEEWILYERYIPQVLSIARNYNESLLKPRPLEPNKDFIGLLVNAAK